MDIIKKLADRRKYNDQFPAVTLAFLGDSVTQGCFETYRTREDLIDTVYDQENAYHHKLAKLLGTLYPNVPINLINAGISGDNAGNAQSRVQRDVIAHHPDLTVVCFGLNDSAMKTRTVEDYLQALGSIFDQLETCGTEIIFMTPCMMNTRVAYGMDPLLENIAKNTAQIQNSGILDTYIEAAKSLCAKRNITVCDCYAKWKRLDACGVDITNLFSNKINHPTPDMHWLFAISLLETMLSL